MICCEFNVGALISVCWQNVTPSARQRYEEFAAEDKVRYEKEKVLYQNFVEGCQNVSRGTSETTRVALEGCQPVSRNCRKNEGWKSFDSPEAIKELAHELDDASIDFLIKALK